ncbi:AfsR/SARP family transcriptional regulator, partial [Amycolatopsis pretoriensis]|uniref:AfsR/SARP family transcriptional regulator n=1 Tax=Amycolatopsis pretoriensis TaxID=218821 RepID=UPI0024AEE888
MSSAIAASCRPRRTCSASRSSTAASRFSTSRPSSASHADAARADVPETAVKLLAEAESLWRGDPLEDLPTAPAWDAELGRLVENRLAAVEERLALQVRPRRHDAAIAEL